MQYMQNLTIEGGKTVEGALHNYQGIFTSTSLNTQNFRLSKKTMSDIVRQANEGVEVRKSHSWDDPIGKFTSAWVYDGKGKGNFFIREGLEGPKSDDVIKMIDSEIMGEMSIGFIHTEETEVVCDACQQLGNGRQLMKPVFSFFGLSFFFECNEGHQTGRKFKLNGEEKTVTYTIEGKVKLREVSVVGTGADPNTDIIKKLQEGLSSQQVLLDDIPYISEYLNIELGQFNQMLGIDPNNPTYSIPQRSSQMAEPTGGLDGVVDELNSTINGLKAQIAELEARPTQEQLDTVNQELATKEGELASVKQELETLKENSEQLIKDGKEARELEQARGHSYLKEYYGENYRDLPDCVNHIQSLEDPKSTVKTLRSLADGFRTMAVSKRPIGRQSKLEDVFVPKHTETSKNFKFQEGATGAGV